jgi:hypothetical protein
VVARHEHVQLLLSQHGPHAPSTVPALFSSSLLLFVVAAAAERSERNRVGGGGDGGEERSPFAAVTPIIAVD